MFGLSPMELLIILLIILLLFGAKRLPDLARGLGQGVREFRNSMSNLTEETKQPENKPTETENK